MEQRGDVGMTVMFDLICSFAQTFVRTGALAFGGVDEKVVALDGESAGVPIRGNEAERRTRYGEVFPRLQLLGSIENGDTIERRVRHKQTSTVPRKGKGGRIGSMLFLSWNVGREMDLGRSTRGR